VRLVSSVHTDIDESTIDLSCRSGSCQVQLEERIWSTWGVVYDQNMGAGGRLNDSREVDSDFFDADHRLVVIATADNTTVEGSWNSVDR